MREFFARYRSGYVVYATFEELQELFTHRRKPIACGCWVKGRLL